MHSTKKRTWKRPLVFGMLNVAKFHLLPWLPFLLQTVVFEPLAKRM